MSVGSSSLVIYYKIGRKNMDKKDQTFAERHPKLNLMIGLVLVAVILIGGVFLLGYIGLGLRNISIFFGDFLNDFVSSTDKLIVVAMITGSVSIVGVVISSIVAKVVEYRFNVKKLLYDKREIPYEQFIDLVYAIMEDSKKPADKRMTDEEMGKRVSEFSRGLTLWGSNRVVKKWIKYRKTCTVADPNNLYLLEEIMYEIRRDVGQKKRLKKGDILSLFINDLDSAIKKLK